MEFIRDLVRRVEKSEKRATLFAMQRKKPQNAKKRSAAESAHA